MGDLVSFDKIKSSEDVLNIPCVEHDLSKETSFMDECYKEGYVPLICPSCGQFMGGNRPMSTEWFECGVCRAKWQCSNFRELFEAAYGERD